MLSSILSNVPLGTANTLSYLMLVVVAIFLISGPSITIYYWRKNKKMKAAAPTGSA
jgi:uncharacterized membrane protein